MEWENLGRAVAAVVELLAFGFVVGVGGIWLLRQVTKPARPVCGRPPPLRYMFREVLQYPRVGAPFLGLGIGALAAFFVGPSSDKAWLAGLGSAVAGLFAMLASKRSFSMFEVRDGSTQLGRFLLIALWFGGVFVGIAGAAGAAFTLSMFIVVCAFGSVLFALLAYQFFAAPEVITEVVGPSRQYEWKVANSCFQVHYEVGKKAGQTRPSPVVVADGRRNREQVAGLMLLADAVGRDEVPTQLLNAFSLHVVGEKKLNNDWVLHVSQIEYWLRGYLENPQTKDVGPMPPHQSVWHKRGWRPLFT